jgi:hypothetical protein
MKDAFDALKKSEAQLRTFIDRLPALARPSKDLRVAMQASTSAHSERQCILADLK